MEHPEYLVAALLALVPLLVYGVPYLRVRERSFPALHFLLKRYPTRFQRFRSLNRVLIAVRTGLILLIVALYVVPSTEVAMGIPSPPGENVGLIIVVSTSVEMSESTPEGTLLDLARRRAAAWLGRSERHRFLVVGSCDGLPEPAVWGDRDVALDAIHGLRQSQTWCPAGPVVLAVRRRWAGNAVEVVVIDRPGGAEPRPEVMVDPAVTRLPPGDLPWPARGGATLLDATLSADGLRIVASLQGVGTEVSMRCCGEGEPAAATRLAGTGIRSATLVPSAACSGEWWEVYLEPDGLDAGDRVWVPVPARPTLDVLLVDGGFGGRLEDRRTRYLEEALQSLDSKDLRLRLKVLTQEELTDARIDKSNLVVLADPHPLRAHLRRSLAAHLEAGGGLIVTAGQRLTRWKEGQELIPGRWRTADLPEGPGPVLETPPGGSSELGALLAATQATRRPLVIRRLVLSGIDGDEAKTVVRFADGIPAVVRWTRGRGTAFLWAVSADLSDGELPLHAAFPLILGSQVREIAAGLQRSSDALRCVAGVPCDLAPRIPPGWDLEDARGSAAADLQDRLARGDATLPLGPYLLRRGDERRLVAILDLPPAARRAVTAKAVAPSSTTQAPRVSPPTPRETLWHRTPMRLWILLAALLFMLLEGWVALRQ